MLSEDRTETHISYIILCFFFFDLAVLQRFVMPFCGYRRSMNFKCPIYSSMSMKFISFLSGEKNKSANVLTVTHLINRYFQQQYFSFSFSSDECPECKWRRENERAREFECIIAYFTRAHLNDHLTLFLLIHCRRHKCQAFCHGKQ